MTLTLTSDLENLFRNGHAHGAYFVPISLKSVHYLRRHRVKRTSC